jgi:16S rRNA (cytidine1402-2'-O)-methyltransferase
MTDSAAALVLVPTPIGNLGDITLRALETLRAARYLVAEDTRRTRKLLSHFEIDASKLSRFDANATDYDIARILDWVADGQTVALVTDAGCPAVSDPGSALVRAAIARDLPVIALPGASAVTVAVAVSGLVDSAFWFLGFLPRGVMERAERVGQIANTKDPVVIFEAPQRMEETLHALADAMPNRQIVITRELSKIHEEIIRGPLSKVASEPREWIGEITFVLGAYEQKEEELPDDAAIDTRIDQELASGVHTRTVAERIAAWCGKPRREVYQRVLERKSAMR